MNRKILSKIIGGLSIAAGVQMVHAYALSYPIVDTVQKRCFDTTDVLTKCPEIGEAMHGQDAQYMGIMPSLLVQQLELLTIKTIGSYA